MIINLGDAPFKAFIKVTYNAGTCTCKLGSETFTHSGGGTATFTVKKKGTWAVTVAGRLESKSSNVEVSKSGETYSVTINVNQSLLYQAGNEYTSITGGWTTKAVIIAGGSYAVAPTITRNSDNLFFVEKSGSNSGAAYMKNKINLNGVKTLSMKIRTNAVDEVNGRFHIWNGAIATSDEVLRKDVSLNNNSSTGYDTVTIDVTNLNGSYYLGFAFCAYGVQIELRLNELKLT